MEEEIIIRLGLQDDLEDLINFLSSPPIDHSFQKPLTLRKMSIKERAYNVYLNGTWILSFYKDKLCGCRGIKFDKVNRVVRFTTFVVDPALRRRGIGQKIFKVSTEYAIQTYNPLRLFADSWEGNCVFEHIAKNNGFRRVRAYFDPSNRPNNIRTVEYEYGITLCSGSGE